VIRRKNEVLSALYYKSHCYRRHQMPSIVTNIVVCPSVTLMHPANGIRRNG